MKLTCKGKMNIVYILQSTKNNNRHYAGICTNLKKRLAEHNSGECKTTAGGGPWRLETALYFSNQEKASVASLPRSLFERY